MESSDRESRGSESVVASSASARSRWRFRPGAITLLLICSAVGGLAAYWAISKPAQDLPDGMLVVFVRPKGIGEPLQVDSPAALPVYDGGSMNLEVQHRAPACTYLIWINTSGQVSPLYPWNNSQIEVTDLNSPPPARRPGQIVHSPLAFGGVWEFRPGNGLETVLLLARKTPLPADKSVGQLIGELP